MVANSGTVHIERIDSLAELSKLGATWDDIQRRCHDKHVLLDHRWVMTWLKVFGKNSRICVLVLRVGDAVAGIVPFIITRSYELFPTRRLHVHTGHDYQYTRVPRFVRWAPIRRLSFPLSVAVANRRSHFLFVEDDPRLYARTMEYVASISAEWDLLVIEGFASGSAQERLLLNATAESGLSDDGRHAQRISLLAHLPASMDAFLAAKSNHFRKRMKAECRQAAERAPGLRLQEYRGSQIDEGMDRLFALERRSWKAGDARARVYHVGPLPQLETFHREVARAFAATDAAMVLTMDVGDRSVAAIFCVERDGVMSAIVTFRDEEFSNRLTAAPLFRRLVEIAIDRGLTALDFNGNTTNIEKWADGSRISSRFLFYNRQPYSRFLRTVSHTAHLGYGAVSSIRRSFPTLVSVR